MPCSARPRDLFEFCNRTAAAGFVNGLLGAAGISLPAEFALGRERSRTLFARSGFGPGEFLPFAGEARLGDAPANATGAFRTSLAAISLSFVCISFSGPLVLDYCATGARRQRGRCVCRGGGCSFFFNLHKRIELHIRVVG